MAGGRLRKVDGAGVITTLVDKEQFTYGHGGITTDAAGNIWLADGGSNSIRRFDATGRGGMGSRLG